MSIMNNLNDDELEYIMCYLEIKDILILSRVGNQFYMYYCSPRMIHILSCKLNMKNATLHQLLLRYHRNSVLPLISLLSHLYHVNSGFKCSMVISCLNLNKSKREKYIEIASNNGIIYEGDQNTGMGKIISDMSKIKDNDFLFIRLDYSYLSRQSKVTVHFKTVILKRTDNKNSNLIPEWYNIPSLNARPVLPCLNTRPYIIIDIPFKQITISSEIKQTLITVEDVLFSMRALSLNNFGCFSNNGNFKISDENNYDLLCIEPDIF